MPETHAQLPVLSAPHSHRSALRAVRGAAHRHFTSLHFFHGPAPRSPLHRLPGGIVIGNQVGGGVLSTVIISLPSLFISASTKLIETVQVL